MSETLCQCRGFIVKASTFLSAILLLLVIGALARPAYAVPVLLGSGTLNTANDLTVVQNGTVNYEFLDLTATYGLSVASSVGLYGGSGFHWANGADMTVLLGAFNIAYGHFPGGGLYAPTSLNPLVSVNAIDAANLATFLGKAPGVNGALGWIDEDTSLTNHTYICTGDACTPKIFLQQGQPFWPAVSIIGTFLVRNYDTAPPQSSVPVPGALALFSLGLAGLGVMRRRKTT